MQVNPSFQTLNGGERARGKAQGRAGFVESAGLPEGGAHQGTREEARTVFEQQDDHSAETAQRDGGAVAGGAQDNQLVESAAKGGVIRGDLPPAPRRDFNAPVGLAEPAEHREVGVGELREAARDRLLQVQSAFRPGGSADLQGRAEERRGANLPGGRDAAEDLLRRSQEVHQSGRCALPDLLPSPLCTVLLPF